MNGNSIFLDTNIILYLLSGDKTIADAINDKLIYISVITEMELLSFSKLSKEDEVEIKKFISNCEVVYINSNIKNEAIRIRKNYGKKLPDAIIIASAIHLDTTLITSDNDFKGIENLRLAYYQK